ncbi:MAG: hypothetical protein DMG24_03440 [Acidobacteria bacterium]|nr:MAG: hypothetical protein DMG24_03440 [Acidobacteriota bacterium]
MQGDQRQPFASGERAQQFVQLASRHGGAVKNLVRGVVIDLCVPRSARPLLLLDPGVQVPDAIDELGDTARAAQVSRQLVLVRSANLGMQEVAQPAPFEVGGTHGLRLVSRQQQ